jgi:hypothetical protein
MKKILWFGVCVCVCDGVSLCCPVLGWPQTFGLSESSCLSLPSSLDYSRSAPCSGGIVSLTSNFTSSVPVYRKVIDFCIMVSYPTTFLDYSLLISIKILSDTDTRRGSQNLRTPSHTPTHQYPLHLLIGFVTYSYVFKLPTSTSVQGYGIP